MVSGGEDVAAEPGTIDLLELEWLDRVTDAAHRCRIERYVVRIAVHEAHGSAVLGHHDDIPGEERALAVGAAGPVEDGAPGEMATAVDQGDPRRELPGGTVPEHHL